MKIFRRLLACALLIALCVMLTGCGAAIKGSWRLTGGSAMSMVNGGNYSATDGEVVFTFGINDVFTLNIDGALGQTAKTGVWTRSGEEVTLSIDGTSTVCMYSVDSDVLTLVFTLNGQRSTLELARTDG